MATTFTRTNVQYSAKPEQLAVKMLLDKSGLSGFSIPNEARLHSLTELAGIARMELNNKESLGPHASMVNAHYDDFGRTLEDLGDKNYRYDWQNQEVVQELGKLMNDASQSVEGQTSQPTLIDRVKQVMKLAEEKKLELTMNDTFALGVALNVCAGDKDDRDKWWDRKKLTPEQILEKRKIKDEDIVKLKGYWDEIKRIPAVVEHGSITKE